MHPLANTMLEMGLRTVTVVGIVNNDLPRAEPASGSWILGYPAYGCRQPCIDSSWDGDITRPTIASSLVLAPIKKQAGLLSI